MKSKKIIALISLCVAGITNGAECKILVHDYERDSEIVDAKLVNGVLTLPKRDANSAAFLVMF
jgi:hypothetical protein